MEKSSLVFLLTGCLSIGFVLVLAHQTYTITKEIKALKGDMQKHQDWLFEQLCRIAPGKVLLPEQEESEEVGAVVVNPKDNPMNEFNGQKTDWFV